MTSEEIDAYLAEHGGPHLVTMSALRDLLEELLPTSEQGLSYGAPAFRVGGRLAGGFSAAKRHVTFFPHSGTVLGSLDPVVLEGYVWSKGAVQLPLGQEPPRGLVEAVVRRRLEELA